MEIDELTTETARIIDELAMRREREAAT